VRHAILQHPKAHSFLLLIDEELAAKARTSGRACGGMLHSTPYPRKRCGASLRTLDRR